MAHTDCIADPYGPYGLRIRMAIWIADPYGYMDWQSLWVIRIANPYEPYGLSIRMFLKNFHVPRLHWRQITTQLHRILLNNARIPSETKHASKTILTKATYTKGVRFCEKIKAMQKWKMGVVIRVFSALMKTAGCPSKILGAPSSCQDIFWRPKFCPTISLAWLTTVEVKICMLGHIRIHFYLFIWYKHILIFNIKFMNICLKLCFKISHLNKTNLILYVNQHV